MLILPNIGRPVPAHVRELREYLGAHHDVFVADGEPEKAAKVAQMIETVDALDERAGGAPEGPAALGGDHMTDAAGQSVLPGHTVAYAGYVDATSYRQRLATVVAVHERRLSPVESYWVADLVIDGVPIVANELQIVRVGGLDALERLVEDARGATDGQVL